MVMVMRSKNSSTTCGGCSSGVIFWGYWRCVGFLKLSIIYLQAIVATVRLTGCNGLGKIPNLCLLVAKLQMVGNKEFKKLQSKWQSQKRWQVNTSQFCENFTHLKISANFGMRKLDDAFSGPNLPSTNPMGILATLMGILEFSPAVAALRWRAGDLFSEEK